MSVLNGLATSSSLRRKEFSEFHERAKRTVKSSDEIIVLRTFDTEQILNTGVPFGDHLPPAISLIPEEIEAYKSGAYPRFECLCKSSGWRTAHSGRYEAGYSRPR